MAARGVRLKGRLLPSGKVSWGQIDKLLPPPTRQAVHASRPDRRPQGHDRSRSRRHMGRWASRSRGAAICPAGSRGGWRSQRTSFVRAPARSTSSAPSSRIGVVARRPQVQRTDRRHELRLPGEQSAARRAADGNRFQLLRGVRQLRRQGSPDARLVRGGRQRPCRRHSNLSFKGTATDILGPDRPVRAAGAAGANTVAAHAVRWPIPARTPSAAG